MSWRIQDARHWSAFQTAPSVSDMNFEHSRWIRWGGPIFGLLWLWPLVARLGDVGPERRRDPARRRRPRRVLRAVPGRGDDAARPVLPPVLAMLAIAVGLTLGVDDAFGWLFVWAGSAASVRLTGRSRARRPCAAITALAAATLALTDPDAAAVLGHHRRGLRDQRAVAADRRADAGQRGAARGARRAGRDGRGRGARALLARPARPARPRPLADRAQGRAGPQAAARPRRTRRRPRSSRSAS